MTLRKPHRQTSFFDYFPLSKRFKLSEKVQIGASSNCTCLEDFPNEIFSEIFEYLYTNDIYISFFDLNQRFRDLIYNYQLPFKVNLSLISKSNFKRFKHELLIPNRQQIQTLHISNPFFVDSIFSSIQKIRKFTRLEALIFNDVKLIHLPNILRHLILLENLSTLIIISQENLGNIFESIFCLSKLKYLKIKFKSTNFQLDILSNRNSTSLIEHLIFDGDLNVECFKNLLSYFPYLQNLHINSIYSHLFLTHLQPRLNQLKRFQIDDLRISFDTFEFLSREIFNKIEILRLSVRHNDARYLNADRWEQLITNSMSKLRIFDFQYYDQLDNQHDEDSHVFYKTILNRFASPFWTERNWFFDYQFYRELYECRTMFYSINSKRKECIFYEDLTKFSGEEYVEYIKILDENTMLKCKQYFPRTKQLILSNNFCKNSQNLSNILENLMPLKQLTKLTITIQCNFSIKQIISLLNTIPNIQILHLNWNFIKLDDFTEIEQSEIFQNLAKNNKISHLIIDDRYRVETIKLFFTLCSRIQHLTIEIFRRFECDGIIRFLLGNKQLILPKLCLLNLKNVQHPINKHFEILVNRSNIHSKCWHKIIRDEFFICFS